MIALAAVAPSLQMTISQTYAALADSITHNKPDVEKAILTPRFADRARIKLDVYEYDPLTVLVQKIESKGGSALLVHAQWVGVGKNRENTVDRWLLVDGTWRLAERDKTRP